MRKQPLFPKRFLWICIYIFMAIALSACGKGESTEIEEKAFGIDYSKELAVSLAEQVVCGRDHSWAITTIKNDFIYKIAHNSDAVGMEELEWQPEEGKYSIVNIAERSGVFYAQMQNREDDTIVIRKQAIDGRWRDLMSVRAAEGENYAVVGSGFYVDSSEKAYLVSGSKVICFDEEGQRIRGYDLKGEVCFFRENGEGYVECVTVDAKEIRLYELTESEAIERWGYRTATRQVHQIQNSGEEMLCLATDQEILFLDRKSGEPLARTDLVKIGVGSVLAGYYDESERILRLYSLSGDGAESLHYSLLRERDASEEQRTELVYGMVGGVNADTSSSIWTAITAFNQENKEYYVSIKNYDNNTDRLHADMAAGKGPDIIDMTYSDYYESYVKNGYLENLLPYLERSQYKDDMLWNALNAYEKDDGLYVFMPQFQVQGLLLHPEYEVSLEEWNMEMFLELMEENHWEKDIFGGLVGDPDYLLLILLQGRQEEFIDWERKTAAFETEEFIDLLTLCMEYAQADWSDAKNWTYEEHKRATMCMPRVFGGGFYSYLGNADVYGREYQIYGYPTLSGQTYGIAPCSDSCAIYAGSKQKEGAWEFIESLLWESNQKHLGIANPGFPIRKSVLEEMAEESKTEEVRSGNETITITESEISILRDILYKGNLSDTSIDRDILRIIQEETAAYFAGDKSAQEVARIIQSRVELILNE